MAEEFQKVQEDSWSDRWGDSAETRAAKEVGSQGFEWPGQEEGEDWMWRAMKGVYLLLNFSTFIFLFYTFWTFPVNNKKVRFDFILFMFGTTESNIIIRRKQTTTSSIWHTEWETYWNSDTIRH